MSNDMEGEDQGEALSSLEKLEDAELGSAAPQNRPSGAKPPSADQGELPSAIYRLKSLHSNETFFGYTRQRNGENLRYRTRDQLEAALEGPSGPSNAAPQTPRREEEGDIPPQPEGQKPEAVSAADQIIPKGALVVAPTKYGRDVVIVQGLVADKSIVVAEELAQIERPVTVEDLRKLKDNEEKEKNAYVVCRDKIWARNLPMKLVSAHCLLEEQKILFYFTAESRVDFRELVKDLVGAFKSRIELRQIGVRDEARVTGGLGVCGRTLCCHGVSDKLNPVSIKMAKDQNLSLNSLKISGPCGRLLCCLSYEHQFYKDARRELPSEGIKFVFENVLFRVIEVNALASTVKLSGEDGRLLDMKAERFRYSDGRWHIAEE